MTGETSSRIGLDDSPDPIELETTGETSSGISLVVFPRYTSIGRE